MAHICVNHYSEESIREEGLSRIQTVIVDPNSHNAEYHHTTVKVEMKQTHKTIRPSQSIRGNDVRYAEPMNGCVGT